MTTIDATDGLLPSRPGETGSRGTPPPTWSCVTELAGSEQAPALARAWVLARLGQEKIAAPRDDAALIVSELVTNSIVHARVDASQMLMITLKPVSDGCRLTVIDPGSDTEPRIRARSAASRGGWGLSLVDRLCTDWGTHRDAAGATHVWCDLPNQQVHRS